MKKKDNIQYCFGLTQERCGTDLFDTIEELIEYADDCYKLADGDYWDEDSDDYPDVIYIGVAHKIAPMDYAPSLDDITDMMTDKFYCDNNIDDDQDVVITDRKAAQAAWETFIKKYIEMPCSVTATWIGQYDIKEHKWVEQYGKG